MISVKIYEGSVVGNEDRVIYEGEADSGSYEHRIGEPYRLSLKIKLPYFVDFPVGCELRYKFPSDGYIYKLDAAADVVMNASDDYEYTLNFVDCAWWVLNRRLFSQVGESRLESVTEEEKHTGSTSRTDALPSSIIINRERGKGVSKIVLNGKFSMRSGSGSAFNRNVYLLFVPFASTDELLDILQIGLSPQAKMTVQVAYYEWGQHVCTYHDAIRSGEVILERRMSNGNRIGSTFESSFEYEWRFTVTITAADGGYLYSSFDANSVMVGIKQSTIASEYIDDWSNISFTLDMSGGLIFTVEDTQFVDAGDPIGFSLYGKLDDYLRTLAECCNRDVITQAGSNLTCANHNNNQTDARMVEFKGNTYMEAINKVCEAFGYQWMIEEKFNVDGSYRGVRLTVGEIVTNASSPLMLGYNNKTLKSPVRASVDNSYEPIKRLYIRGGDKNVDPLVYANRWVKLPKGKYFLSNGTLAGSRTQSGVTYLSETGWYIEDVTVPSGKDVYLEAGDIYPSKLGIVSQLRVAEQGSWGIRWRIWTDIDYTPYITTRAQDSNNFSYLQFQSGALAGECFEFEMYRSDSGWWIVIKPEWCINQMANRPIPSTDKGYEIKAGDTFRVYNIKLPTEYYTDAEERLVKVGLEYLMNNNRAAYNYSGTTNAAFGFTQHELNITDVFTKVLLQDNTIKRNEDILRLNSVKIDLNRDMERKVEFGNIVNTRTSSLEKLINKYNSK